MKKINLITPILGVLSVLPSTILTTSCNNSKPRPVETELKITEQPKAIQKVAYPNGVEFSVSVNKPDLVKSYQWQIEKTAGKWVSLEGFKARNSSLSLPSTCHDSNNARYRCEITDKNDKIIYSEPGEIIITNDKEFIPLIKVAEYSITPRQTFDLSKTIYGSGTISMNSSGDTVTFNNVMFNNLYYEYGHTVLAPTIEMDTISNTIEKYTFKFEGQNVINNTYDKTNTLNGSSLGMFFPSSEVKDVTVELVGDGDLTVVGGTYCILAYAKLIVDLKDLNLIKPSHYNHDKICCGINCNGIEIKNNALINASLSGSIIESTKNNYGLSGEILIDDNVIINASIDCAFVPRGRSYSEITPLRCNDFIKIKNAIINISVIADIGYAIDNSRKANLDFISSTTNQGHDSIIEGSIISIGFIPYNEYPGNGYIGVFNDASGIKLPNLQILNSKLKINIQSKNILQVKGIDCLDALVQKSNLEIITKCNGRTIGFHSEYSQDDTGGEIIIKSSSMDIDCESFDSMPTEDYPYINTGICAHYLTLNLDQGDLINVNAKNAATIVLETEHSQTKATKQPISYVPKQIEGLDGIEIAGDNICWNMGSYVYPYYSKEGWYTNYESIFNVIQQPEKTVGDWASSVVLYKKI